MADKIAKKTPKSKKRFDSFPKMMLHPPKNLPFWVASIIFAITTVIFFWDQIIQQSFFWEDFVEYVFPVQTFAAKEFAKGVIPFWNPYTFVGMPFFADLQVGFFYPFNRILSLFINQQGLPVIALEAIIILHFLIAQINSYLLSRYFKISSFGAIIGAISYSFSMLMVCHVIHPMIVYHLAWLPLILMFFMKGLEQRKISSAIISGIIFGFTMLSGHPQMTLYIGLLLGLVFLWLFINGIKNNKIKGLQFFGFIASGLIPILLAVGIFCIQYLPSKQLADLSQRSEISYQKANEGSLSFKNIYTSIVPKIFGSVDGSVDKPATYYLKNDGVVQRHFYWETGFYFGLIGLFLGLIGAIIKYKSNYGSLFIFLSLFGFLFSMGSGGIIFDLLYKLPYFGGFRNPGRMLSYTVLGFSILAGFGFDSLWENLKAKKMMWVILSAAAIPLIIALLTATGFMGNSLGSPDTFKEILISYGSTALIIVLIGYAISFITNWKIIDASIGGILLVILTFVDLYLAGYNFNQSTQNPATAYELKPEIKSLLTPKLPDEIFRVNMRIYKPVSFMAMQRNQGLIDNLMLVEGYNPLILERAAVPVEDLDVAYNLYNVKYEIKVDLEKGSWAFTPRENYFKRAWLVNSVIVKNENQVKDFMKTNKINYLNTAIVEEPPALKLSGNPIDTANTSVSCFAYQTNKISYKVKTPESSQLVFSEIYYPEWKAYIDGKPVKIFRTNYSFRSVNVPAGLHFVEMRFESEAYSTGKIISMITLILGIVGFFVTHHFERDRTEKEKNVNKEETETQEINKESN